ncbi:hypothetical protein, partial [Methylibium sp. T29-B]|uniref:hypothetical protein n=1 Tax=Methylibium sp. T29-B TaxID=1437443 RepID=UPI001E32BC19
MVGHVAAVAVGGLGELRVQASAGTAAKLPRAPQVAPAARRALTRRSASAWKSAKPQLISAPVASGA